MKTIQKIGFIFIVLSSISACKGLKVKDIKTGNDPTTTLLVSHYKVECDEKYKRDLCLQIKKKGNSSWEQYAGDIKNFNYTWGFDYEIEVTSKTVSPKPSDAPSIEYTRKKDISKNKTLKTNLFVLTVSRKSKTTTDAIKKPASNDTIYRIYNDINIKCDEDQCKFIKAQIDSNNAVKFILSHDNKTSNLLNISSIPCASGRNSFKTDCKD